MKGLCRATSAKPASYKKRSNISMVIFKFDFAGSIVTRTKFSQFSPAGLFKVFIVLLLTYSFGFYFVSDFIR